MLDAYMRDPIEGGEPPSERVKRDLVPSLRAHPACYVFLAWRDGTPVRFTICFLGFSTFLAHPLIDIHDIFVDSSVRGRGIGAMLLERIEAKARELMTTQVAVVVGILGGQGDRLPQIFHRLCQPATAMHVWPEIPHVCCLRNLLPKLHDKSARPDPTLPLGAI